MKSGSSIYGSQYVFNEMAANHIEVQLEVGRSTSWNKVRRHRKKNVPGYALYGKSGHVSILQTFLRSFTYVMAAKINWGIDMERHCPATAPSPNARRRTATTSAVYVDYNLQTCLLGPCFAVLVYLLLR